MIRKLLFDASVYIQAFRQKRLERLAARRIGKSDVYFSSVAGAELLRGTRDRSSLRQVEQLWRDFQIIERLVVPGTSDWHEAGIAPRQLGMEHGYESIGQARLLADVLIALSARRLGISVVTLNVADFRRIAEVRRFSVLTPEELAM